MKFSKKGDFIRIKILDTPELASGPYKNPLANTIRNIFIDEIIDEREVCHQWLERPVPKNIGSFTTNGKTYYRSNDDFTSEEYQDNWDIFINDSFNKWIYGVETVIKTIINIDCNDFKKVKKTLMGLFINEQDKELKRCYNILLTTIDDFYIYAKPGYGLCLLEDE